jgi:hypothetical protein
MVFDHWELLDKDGNVKKALYPGNHFTVYKEDAVEKIIEQDASGHVIEATYTVTLKPAFVPIGEETTTTITYDPNGGDGEAITLENVKINDGLTAKPANTFTRAGYEFVEWNTQADGSGESFAAGAEIAADLLTRDVKAEGDGKNPVDNILYAQWKCKQYTVKYTDGVEDEEVFEDQITPNLTVLDETPKFKGDDPEREGYRFGGWDPEVSQTIDPSQADEDNVITYTAVWKKLITVDVTFKVVNGSWDDKSGDEAKADITVTLSGIEGEDLKLAEDQIPGVGNTPDPGFKAGDWNPTPDTETAITEDTTYTYT